MSALRTRAAGTGGKGDGDKSGKQTLMDKFGKKVGFDEKYLEVTDELKKCKKNLEKTEKALEAEVGKRRELQGTVNGLVEKVENLTKKVEEMNVWQRQEDEDDGDAISLAGSMRSWGSRRSVMSTETTMTGAEVMKVKSIVRKVVAEEKKERRNGIVIKGERWGEGEPKVLAEAFLKEKLGIEAKVEKASIVRGVAIVKMAEEEG